MQWSETEKCPECNADLIYTREGSCASWNCTECEWGIATTLFTPIMADKIVYEYGGKSEMTDPIAETKYTFDDIKEKLNRMVAKGGEPELTLHMYGKEYMIIAYKTKCSFTRCGANGGSGEIFYHSLDELYNAKTIDNIVLKRDWNDITDFDCWEYHLYFDEDF